MSAIANLDRSGACRTIASVAQDPEYVEFKLSDSQIMSGIQPGSQTTKQVNARTSFWVLCRVGVHDVV